MVKFLILGNMNAITYKEIFPLIKDNKMWYGITRRGIGLMWFLVPDADDTKSGFKIIDGKIYRPVGSTCWFTNLDNDKRHKPLELTKVYDPDKYPRYDNYDAINVDKVKDIPMDYKGVMGVPISFLDKWCPEQFEIVKFRKGDDDKDLSVNGKCPYFRALIKNLFINDGRINGEKVFKRIPIRRKEKDEDTV